MLKVWILVLKNIISMLVLQGGNYLAPLVLFPLLVHRLGIEAFGVLAFATAFSMFFKTCVSYGFDLTGTKYISLNRNNKFKVNKAFNEILWTKIFLVVLSLLIFILLIILFESLKSSALVFSLTFLIVIGEALFPQWFFLGIEKMKFIAVFKLVYKVLFIVSVYFIVNNESQVYLVPLIDGLGSIGCSIFALLYIKYKHNISIYVPHRRKIYLQLKKGWYVFVSNLAVVFYTSFNVFLLGLLVSPKAVGLYTIAEKIYMALRGLLIPVTQALFPYLSRLHSNNYAVYTKKIRLVVLLYMLVLIIFGFILNNYSGFFVYIISGNMSQVTVDILVVFSYSIIFSLGGILSSQLIIRGLDKALSAITLITVLTNLVLIFPLTYFYQEYGVAYTFLIVQMVHFIYQVRNNFEIFKNKENI
jgi:PST family polysaccharide transporter